jgi:6-phospho-beta-glucosidase
MKPIPKWFHELPCLTCGSDKVIHYGNVYPVKGSSENVMAALRYNDLQYYFTDMNARGYVPSYMYRFYEENGFDIEITKQDEEDLKNTLDFVTFSYYYTTNITEEGKQVPNDNIRDKNAWGWGLDPVGLRVALNEYWDRYQKPLIVTENGMGFYDKVEEDGSIHDPYRVDFYRRHIAQVKEALHDGVNILGYYMWGPIDIVSCSSSEMAKRYGFIYVDLDNYGKGSGKRTLKDSYAWVQKVLASNGQDLD